MGCRLLSVLRAAEVSNFWVSKECFALSKKNSCMLIIIGTRVGN